MAAKKRPIDDSEKRGDRNDCWVGRHGWRGRHDYFEVDNPDGRPLDPCYTIRNHSPTGFAWGYEGSGPAQLALAILVDHFRRHWNSRTIPVPGDAVGSAIGQDLYQVFKRQVIAKLPMHEDFRLSSADVDVAVRSALAGLQGSRSQTA